MPRTFKTKVFQRWLRKSDLSDDALCAAVVEMTNGLIDANLGGSLVKKRVALPGRGKRGGARTIVGTHLGERWFFLFGFAKNERDNIDADELHALRELATTLLSLDDDRLAEATHSGLLTEICHDTPHPS